METLEYIDAYFQQTLSEEEKKQFEARCENDNSFAEEVAFYITSRSAIREKLLEQKQQTWRNEAIEEEPISFTTPLKKLYHYKWVMYAAASLILAFAIYFFEKPATGKQLASAYVNDEYETLPQTMGSSADSMQQAVTAYNSKHYTQALVLFKAVYKSNPEKTDAKEYAGIVYLQLNNYDKAIQEFEELANVQGLEHNPGLFLEAAALLFRSKKGDAAKAKILLQQVVQQHLDGSEKAAEWLNRI